MNILVVGDSQNLEECQAKFGNTHNYISAPDHQGLEMKEVDVVFDFRLDEDPFEIDGYLDNNEVPIFLNSAKVSLAEISNLANHQIKSTIFGFNGLPTFLNRAVLEVSLSRSEQTDKLEKICQALSTDYLVVDDRVGLVTPRIICMIINEAFYTVQEGTATREDIDQAMKLGTNYPFGPFEWCQRIGIHHVYELLEAVYNDTHDERYKICPLLKKEYLNS